MHAPAYGSVSHRVAWSALCVVPHSYGYVVENFNSTRSNVLHHCRTSPFRLTPRVVRRLCVAAQRNPWAPRGRSRGPGDKRGAPARCLVLYRREPKRPKPVRDEAEAGRRTFSNICISRTSRVCIVPTHPTACPYSRVCMLGDGGVSHVLPVGVSFYQQGVPQAILLDILK